MQILHRLSKHRAISRLLYWAIWPAVFLIAPFTVRARVVIIHQRKVLLVKHSFGADVWMLPGGGIKIGEDAKLAGIREVKEELGITLQESKVKSLHSSPYIWRFDGLFFRVMISKTEIIAKPNIKKSFEIMDIQWFSIDSREVQRALPRQISALDLL